MNKLPIFLMIVLLTGAVAIAQQPSTGAPQAQPAGKRPPQAKTQQEYKDYNSSYGLKGGAAAEKAATGFAGKYPQSELREYLYAKAMHDYQNENNPGKMLAMGEKVLALDPDNSIALVLTATVLADSLSDSDQDREQKIAEIKKNSNHALETVESSFTPPANASPEQIEAYKGTLQSMAHSALGIMELKAGNDPGAEKDLRAAADLNKTQPDPYIWYHLALAQDHQGKYAEALASVNQALQYTSSNPDLGRLAEGERERLAKLTGAPSPPGGSVKPPQ
ncbi:MAG TPA: tetratricopeptide repeat protein [Candidatus Angelobacter sp.]